MFSEQGQGKNKQMFVVKISLPERQTNYVGHIYDWNGADGVFCWTEYFGIFEKYHNTNVLQQLYAQNKILVSLYFKANKFS